MKAMTVECFPQCLAKTIPVKTSSFDCKIKIVVTQPGAATGDYYSCNKVTMQKAFLLKLCLESQNIKYAVYF